MTSNPTGTVTFLFTDIEGSTKLAQQYPNAIPSLLARHHEILRQSIQAQNGYVFQNDGDSLAVAFHSALDALNAALNAQRLFQNEAWTPAPIKVRMGIHTSALISTPSTSRHLTETDQFIRASPLPRSGRVSAPAWPCPSLPVAEW